MKIIEIAFAGYPVTNLKRARAFYEGALGLKPARTFGNETDAWIEYDIGAGTLSITNMAPEWKPSPGGGSVALEVEDFPAAIQQLKSAGYSILLGPFETPVCHMAVVSDPDGNSVNIHKRKAVYAREQLLFLRNWSEDESLGRAQGRRSPKAI